jgi:hypothetical protein
VPAVTCPSIRLILHHLSALTTLQVLAVDASNVEPTISPVGLTVSYNSPLYIA